jgi:hypothetical protein
MPSATVSNRPFHNRRESVDPSRRTLTDVFFVNIQRVALTRRTCVPWMTLACTRLLLDISRYQTVRVQLRLFFISQIHFYLLGDLQRRIISDYITSISIDCVIYPYYPLSVIHCVVVHYIPLHCSRWSNCFAPQMYTIELLIARIHRLSSVIGRYLSIMRRKLNKFCVSTSLLMPQGNT